MPLVRAHDVDEFMSAPLGRFIVGHWFLIWVHSPSLIGSVYFGRPDDRDDLLLMRMFPLPSHPALDPPYDAVIDFSRLQGVTTGAYSLLSQHVQGIEAWAGRVRRVAVVRPAGLAGATVTGVFFDSVMVHFQTALFADASEGFRWLGRPRGTTEHGEVRAIVDDHVAGPSIVTELRAWLAEHLTEASMNAAARVLKRSRRSLQRELAEAGSSFRSELERARVQAAEGLLLDGDDKLEAIAAQVGCTSASHFVALFRRVTGETPGKFRERRR